MALTMDEGTITDWAFPSRGMIRGEALARYVREQEFGGQLIEQMKMPLGIVATDLDSGTGCCSAAATRVPRCGHPARCRQSFSP
jgi:NTE family protein